MLDGAANHRLCQLPLGVLARWVEFEVPFVNHEPIRSRTSPFRSQYEDVCMLASMQTEMCCLLFRYRSIRSRARSRVHHSRSSGGLVQLFQCQEACPKGERS